MKLFVYEVEKIDDWKNTATTIDHDYTDEFNEIKALRGYVKRDYYITDTPDLKPGEVYCTGDLIKVVRDVTTFNGDPITLVFS